jgi:hypothetical protein
VDGWKESTVSIDQRYITRDGLQYLVQVIGDCDATPDDVDCYTDDDKQDWRDCRWQYVGLVVTVEGIEASHASVWGVEWGEMREVPEPLDLDHYIHDESHLVTGLMDDALHNARLYRVALCKLPL